MWSLIMHRCCNATQATQVYASNFCVPFFGHNFSPSYLADRLSYQTHPRNLRSSSMQLLEQRRSFTKTQGEKAFSVCALQLWNSLPLDLRQSPSLSRFKKGIFQAFFRVCAIVFAKGFHYVQCMMDCKLIFNIFLAYNTL